MKTEVDWNIECAYIKKKIIVAFKKNKVHSSPLEDY